VLCEDPAAVGSDSDKAKASGSFRLDPRADHPSVNSTSIAELEAAFNCWKNFSRVQTAGLVQQDAIDYSTRNSSHRRMTCWRMARRLTDRSDSSRQRRATVKRVLPTPRCGSPFTCRSTCLPSSIAYRWLAVPLACLRERVHETSSAATRCICRPSTWLRC
jgi:hypothetical protein